MAQGSTRTGSDILLCGWNRDHDNLILALKPGLHSVRRTYATEMRKRIYASHARRGVYTPRVDLGAYVNADIYAISVAYHFREMDLFYMSRKILRIRIGCGLLINDNPASTRKAGFTLRTQIYGVYADHFAHLGRVFSATNADLRRGIAQVPSVNTPTIRRLLRVDAGLSLANSPQPMRIRKLLRGI